MSERGSKTSTVPVVWANFGIVLAWSKWFPVAIGDHGWNLVVSLWPRDKAIINGVAAKRLTPPLPKKFRVQKSAGKVLSVGSLPRASCFCTTIPRLTGHVQPRRNWPTWASSVLITHHILWFGPVGLPPVPWTEKSIERSPFFVRRGGHCCRGDLVGRRTFWFCFWVAGKS